MALNTVAIFLLIGVFLGLVLLRVPVIFAIAFSTIATTLYLGLPLQMIAQNMVQGINVFVLLTVPFFILAGNMMSEGGISNRLIELANAIVGRVRGGLAMVDVVASMFLGGLTGSSTADASSIGSILIPVMKKNGYSGEFATTVTLSASVQGIMVPPSHNMILFAVVAGGVSIASLFMAGIIPGCILGIALMIYCAIMARIKDFPVGQKVTLSQGLKAFRKSLLALFTVLIVVVGVVAGIFTATESAAIACVYAFIVTFFVYREIPLSRMNKILGDSLKTLSIVMVLIGFSGAFGWLLAYLKVPEYASMAILGFSHNKYVVLAIINVILLILGCLMDMSPIILICTPILLPIVTQVGVNPVHFGVIMMLNLGIGLLTPPVGGTLFIGSAISKIPMGKLTKSMLPFYGVMVLVLILITYIPDVVMFLPHLLGAK
jgi:tripartite ATP-independent transporter DctM subunit